MKKTPSKFANNRPSNLFFSTGLAAETAQKQIFHTTMSPVMQDWVFRLGIWQHLFRTFHYSYKLWGIARRKSVQIFIFKSAYLTKNVYLSLLLSLPIIRYIVCKPSEPGQIVKSNSVNWVVEFLHRGYLKKK